MPPGTAYPSKTTGILPRRAQAPINSATHTQDAVTLAVVSVGIIHVPSLVRNNPPCGAACVSIAKSHSPPACLAASSNAWRPKAIDPLVQSIGVLDIERGQAAEIAELPWQTDTSVGDWFYNVKDVYKTAQHVLDMLVDIVSKNGNLLLNIPQRPDGTLDDECSYLLRQMATWMDGQREGIFASRPWRQAGEGPTNAASGAFQENAVAWTEEDFRFTCKDDTIYAYQMRWPEERQTVIHSLAATTAEPVKSVRLLGHGPVQFTQQTDGLHITLPEVAPSEAPHGFAIDLNTFILCSCFLSISAFLLKILPCYSKRVFVTDSLNFYYLICLSSSIFYSSFSFSSFFCLSSSALYYSFSIVFYFLSSNFLL